MDKIAIGGSDHERRTDCERALNASIADLDRRLAMFCAAGNCTFLDVNAAIAPRGIPDRLPPFTELIQKGHKAFYRARFAGLDREAAEVACRQLRRSDMVCIAFKT